MLISHFRRGDIMVYNGKWLDSFSVQKYDGDEKQFRNKIVLKTPCISFYFTREQWVEFKEKVNQL